MYIFLYRFKNCHCYLQKKTLIYNKPGTYIVRIYFIQFIILMGSYYEFKIYDIDLYIYLYVNLFILNIRRSPFPQSKYCVYNVIYFN